MIGKCSSRRAAVVGGSVAGLFAALLLRRRGWDARVFERATEGPLRALLTDVRGQVHSLSIPPPLIRPEVVRAMRDAARALLAPGFADVVEATEMPFLQPIYDLESPRLAIGRAALIGDAAFVARPHVGAGTTKAGEDALALADALDAEATVEAALQRFEAERRAAGQRVLQRARHLGAYMQAQVATDDERRAAARHRSPEAVMTETAVLTF